MFVVWDIRARSTVDKQKIMHTCDVDMRTAARYIKISDTTLILQPEGRHYRDFLNFRF